MEPLTRPSIHTFVHRNATKCITIDETVISQSDQIRVVVNQHWFCDMSIMSDVLLMEEVDTSFFGKQLHAMHICKQYPYFGVLLTFMY